MQGVLFEATEEQRRLVRAFAGFGVPQEDIARHIGCEPKTLRRHFREELDRGSLEATAKVAQSLFQMATTGKNVAAAIFWMKARAGWREKSPFEPGSTVGYVLSVPAEAPSVEAWEALHSPDFQSGTLVDSEAGAAGDDDR